MSPSVQAFGAALRKGLGRAMILLRQQPDDPALQAELLRACKSRLVYDGQSESYRAPYLHQLIKVTGRQRHFSQELGHWLAETGGNDEDLDIGQAFHVLCLLAEEDASFERTVLHEFIGRARYGMTGAGSIEAFIRLEGLPALLLYVRRFADEIADIDQAWSFKSLIEALEERDGTEAAASALGSARATCPELDRLMALDVDAMYAASDETMDYTTAKASVAAGDRVLLPSAWANHASPEELTQAAQDMLAEHDVRMLRAYLALFRRREFPLPLTTLFAFVRHEDDHVARHAAQILGRHERSDVRKLALELLDGARPWNGITMLRSSRQPGDFLRIGKRLDEMTLDADGWHGVGSAVFHLLEEMEVPPEESRGVLLKLYEEDPCSFCRERIVARLAALGGLPGWMAEECRYDAEPDTVMLVSG